MAMLSRYGFSVKRLAPGFVGASFPVPVGVLLALPRPFLTILFKAPPLQFPKLAFGFGMCLYTDEEVYAGEDTAEEKQH